MKLGGKPIFNFNRRSGMLAPAWARASVLTLTLLLFAHPVLANPTGATVINGAVGFATNGNTLSITNSPNSIINWQSFSINKDEITRFIQQNGASAVLNRITGQDPSKILGTLQSNGRVFIINPNGIVFGKGAAIDVAGLVASTLKMSDADFLNGKYKFGDGTQTGAIKNEGTINSAIGGQVYLIAPDIENNGIITSPKGEIVLAAGHSVSLVDPKNPEIVVSLTAPPTLVVNVGQLVAQGGGIGIYVGLLNTGTISADSVRVDAAGNILFFAAQRETVPAGIISGVEFRASTTSLTFIDGDEPNKTIGGSSVSTMATLGVLDPGAELKPALVTFGMISKPIAIDPSQFKPIAIDPLKYVIGAALKISALPNAGSSIGASNALGSNPYTQSSSSFNALLQAAPSAAIGLDGDSGKVEGLAPIPTR